MHDFRVLPSRFASIFHHKLKNIVKGKDYFHYKHSVNTCGGASDYAKNELEKPQKNPGVGSGREVVPPRVSPLVTSLALSPDGKVNSCSSHPSFIPCIIRYSVNSGSDLSPDNSRDFVYKFRRIVDCINSGCGFMDLLHNLRTNFWSLNDLGIIFPDNKGYACREITYIITVSFIEANLDTVVELWKEYKTISYHEFCLWIKNKCAGLYDFNINKSFYEEVNFSLNGTLDNLNKRGKLTIGFRYKPYMGIEMQVQTTKFNGLHYYDKAGKLVMKPAHQYVGYQKNPMIDRDYKGSALEEACLLLTANMAEFMYRVRKNTSFFDIHREKSSFYNEMRKKTFVEYLNKFDFNLADDQKQFQKVAPTLYFTNEFKESNGRMTFFSCVRLIVEAMEKNDMHLANFMLYKTRGQHSMLFTIERHHEFNSVPSNDGQIVNNIFYKVYIYDSCKGNKLAKTILRKNKFKDPQYQAKVNHALLTSVPSLLSLYGLSYNSYSLGFGGIDTDAEIKCNEILGLSYLHPAGESKFINGFNSFPEDTYEPILRDNNIKNCIRNDIKDNKFEGIMAVICYENNVELAEIVFKKENIPNLSRIGLKIWRMACQHVKEEKILQLIEDTVGLKNGQNIYYSQISPAGMNLLLITLQAKNYVAAKFLVKKGCTLEGSNYENIISNLKEDQIIMEICSSLGVYP